MSLITSLIYKPVVQTSPEERMSWSLWRDLDRLRFLARWAHACLAHFSRCLLSTWAHTYHRHTHTYTLTHCWREKWALQQSQRISSNAMLHALDVTALTRLGHEMKQDNMFHTWTESLRQKALHSTCILETMYLARNNAHFQACLLWCFCCIFCRHFYPHHPILKEKKGFHHEKLNSLLQDLLQIR